MEQEAIGGRVEKTTGRDERRGLPESLIDFTFVKDINREIARVVAMSIRETVAREVVGALWLRSRVAVAFLSPKMILIQEEKDLVNAGLLAAIQSFLAPIQSHFGLEVISANEDDGLTISIGITPKSEAPTE